MPSEAMSLPSERLCQAEVLGSSVTPSTAFRPTWRVDPICVGLRLLVIVFNDGVAGVRSIQCAPRLGSVS